MDLSRLLQPRVTIIVEQPLNSYLRDEFQMLERTDSYLASRKALSGGKPAVSLKDQPFQSQLLSPTYLRAFLVFLVTSFVTNFYVGTFTTEVSTLPSIASCGYPRSYFVDTL